MKSVMKEISNDINDVGPTTKSSRDQNLNDIDIGASEVRFNKM